MTKEILIGTFPIGIYRTYFNKFCDWTGDDWTNTYTDYEKAETKCIEDDSCIGFYDSCGESKIFHLCDHQKFRKIPSRCGSILYLAPRKFSPRQF